MEWIKGNTHRLCVTTVKTPALIVFFVNRHPGGVLTMPLHVSTLQKSCSFITYNTNRLQNLDFWLAAVWAVSLSQTRSRNVCYTLLLWEVILTLLYRSYIPSNALIFWLVCRLIGSLMEGWYRFGLWLVRFVLANTKLREMWLQSCLTYMLCLLSWLANVSHW